MGGVTVRTLREVNPALVQGFILTSQNPKGFIAFMGVPPKIHMVYHFWAYLSKALGIYNIFGHTSQKIPVYL